MVNSWHNRVVDLNGFAGKTINRAEIVTDDETPVGQWDIYYGDIAIFSPNGTVTPLYERQGSVALSYYSNGGMSNTSAVVQTSNSAGDTVTPLTTTTFYHGDHLGSTRLATTAGGWPVSAETYYPFGLEQAVPADANHYKFTGYERDAESTLDHATFRQLSFTQGRWTSPDPYYGSYSWANPQTFNRYSYALNNPMIYLDPSGLDEIIDLGNGCFIDVITYWVTTGGEDPSPAQSDEVTYCLSSQAPTQNLSAQQDEQNNSSNSINLDPIQLAPNSPALTPQAQGCQAKIQGAVDNALNTNSTFLGPTTGPGLSPMGYRNGAYNFNYFAPGVINPVAGSTNGSGRFPGSGLHIPLPGGADPTISPWGYNTAAGGSYFTAHFDTANPLDDLVSFFEHIINDVILRRGHGC